MKPPEPVVPTGGVQQNMSAETVPGLGSETAPAWRTLEAGEVPGFLLRGLVADNKNRWCLADLSVPSGGAKGVCPVTTIVDSGAGITTM